MQYKNESVNWAEIMPNQDAPFEIIYEAHTLQVEIIRSGKSIIYKITNEKKPGVFFVTRAMNAEKKLLLDIHPGGPPRTRRKNGSPD